MKRPKGRLQPELGDPRRFKRFMRKRGGEDALAMAYYSGEADGHERRKPRDHYPQGERRRLYDSGHAIGSRHPHCE